MIKRDIWSKINKMSKSFPVIAITGARQTGKTTFLKEQFKDYKYFNLESPSVLSKIQTDPKGFIENNSKIILDEVQKFPELLSYIQVVVDERKIMADFIISGSENILLSKHVSQSLAGRAGYVNMYPFSFNEINSLKKLKKDWKEYAYKGFMPAVWDRKIDPNIYYDQYIATYIERDLRQISSIQNLNLFRKFIQLLAGRVGQLLNYSSLSNDVGADVKTIENWISILEASYLVFRLQPYYENVGKRVIKSPKIYFTDTGLVCRLLGISSIEELEHHYIVGNIFENLIIIELLKEINNGFNEGNLYFYRDSNQNEVDLILDKSVSQIPIEIKSSSTFSAEFEKGINYWNQLKKSKKGLNGFIIYSGESVSYLKTKLVNWKDARSVFELQKGS